MEIDKEVSDFIISSGDSCLKSMFMRMASFDCSCYATFPINVFGCVNDPDPDSVLEQEFEPTNYVR